MPASAEPANVNCAVWSFNGVEGVLVVGKVGNHHRVDETSGTVLHDGCGRDRKETLSCGGCGRGKERS